MVHPSTDKITAPLEADEPPDVRHGTYLMSSSKPVDVIDSSNRHASAKNDLSFSSDLRPMQEPCTSPHSFTSSVATDATTPRFGCSPGYTDSLSGSPSSISSMMSIASYRRGDTADTEDDPETDLYPVNEVEEIDSHSLASMDISDKSSPPSATLSPSPAEPRRTQSAPVLSKPLKGRIFELLADEDDSGSSGASSPHDWDGEINEPPPPQPNVTPQDTVPPVPSPLCMSISGDTTDAAKPSSIQPNSVSQGTMVPYASPKSPHHTFGPVNRRSRRSSRSKKPLKSALSSSDDERTGRPRHRDRKKHSVRFCLEPQEQRTHSPVDYDRKAHPVHNRLCHDDLRELRDLHMPMDLLASRWSALKLPQNGQKGKCSTSAPELPAYDLWHSTAMQSLLPERPSPAPGPTCLPATEAENTAAVPSSSTVAPAATAHRDPVAELKAVRPPTPTCHGVAGASRSYAVPQEPQQGLSSTLTDSLAARFGLTKPPPPLPGVASSPGPRRTQSDSKLYPMPQSLRATTQNFNPTNNSAGLAPAHASGYESPSTDLGDYGTEYSMMGSCP